MRGVLCFRVAVKHCDPAALEKVVAQVALEGADLVADRGLAHAQAFCGAAEIAVTGSGDEYLQLSERDGHGCLGNSGRAARRAL